MIGSIIGGALSVGGAIAGGISASKAAKRQQRRIEEARKKNEDWYNRRYNEDATQRADAQAALTAVEESIKNRNRRAAATAAIMGGTNESVAAEKAANNEALAQTVSNIVVNGERRKDAIEQQYQANEQAYVDALNQVDGQKAQAIAAAGQGVSSVGGDLLGAFLSDDIANLGKKG